jgi:hypothetical protein
VDVNWPERWQIRKMGRGKESATGFIRNVGRTKKNPRCEKKIRKIILYNLLGGCLKTVM